MSSAFRASTSSWVDHLDGGDGGGDVGGDDGGDGGGNDDGNLSV